MLRYLYVYFPNIPAIATDNPYFFILFCLFTTCFCPYGPSSGEIQHHHLYIYENYHTTAYPLFLQLFTLIIIIINNKRRTPYRRIIVKIKDML
jgi:hypothetical protein